MRKRKAGGVPTTQYYYSLFPLFPSHPDSQPNDYAPMEYSFSCSPIVQSICTTTKKPT